MISITNSLFREFINPPPLCQGEVIWLKKQGLVFVALAQEDRLLVILSETKWSEESNIHFLLYPSLRSGRQVQEDRPLKFHGLQSSSDRNKTENLQKKAWP